MARALRSEYPGAVYHAMCRGNNGQDIFISDAGRRLFLSTLEEVCRQSGWMVHAFVLMSNHYHLLLETPEPNLVAGMKWFQGTYTQRFNALFRRRGHLFQGRYKALPIETSAEGYFREVGQYIHLNPYRAGLAGVGKADALEEYRWSSHPFYAGRLRKVPEWLCRSRLFSACGLEEGKPGCMARYKAMIESRMLGESSEPATPEQEMVERQLRRGWYVGSPAFAEDLVAGVEKSSDNLRGGQRRAHGEQEAGRLLTAALQMLGMEEGELLEMKGTSLEKQAVAWLLKRNTVVTGVWIAGRLRLGHRVNASRAISAIENRSDRAAQQLKNKMLQCTG